MSADTLSDFRAAIEAAGITAPAELVPDGKLHRYHVDGDRKGSRNGWYLFFPDDPPAGAFGCWKRGISSTWCARSEGDMDQAELGAWRRRMDEARKAREAEERRDRERARERARKLWDSATPADPAHPYLVRKGVRPHGIRQLDDRLVVPVTSGGEIAGLQFIEADADAVPGKRFLKGTSKRGHYFPIGQPNGRIAIGEGYATAAAVHEATGMASVVAFDAGNLPHVARAVRARFPDVEIVVAGDNDHRTEGNPGRTAAEEAARAVGGRVAVPTFDPDDPGTDWNDVMVTRGAAAVAAGLGIRNGHPEHRADDGQADDLTLTDTGNSSRLAALHGKRLRFIAPWGRWVVCGEDGFWTLDHRDVQVRELAKDVGHRLKDAATLEPDSGRAKQLFSFGLRSLNAGAIKAMVELARGIDGIPLDHEELDADPWLLGVENGVIDLRTATLRPADPTDLMTLRCPVEYDPDAAAPRWEQALVEWFPDEEVRAYVQRVAGSALVGAQRDHVFVIHYGGGRNGKGTFTRALQRVLGPYGAVVHLGLLVEQKYQQHDTVKADLFRVRLAVASETQRRVKLDEASVKNLTGGDRITARRMREDPWEFDPTHSLWLQTNHLPEIGGRDRGIWSRIRVVKWENTFDGQQQDRDLDAKLAAEAPGVLRWLVDGCRAWRSEGLAEPEAVVRATLAYREAEDTFARFAADVGLVFRADLQIQGGELQELLNRWSDEEGIEANQNDVGAWLRDMGVERKRKRVLQADGTRKQARVWEGVGLDDDLHRVSQVDAL